jgi:hypothetical protein
VQRAAMRRFRRWADQRQAAFAVERGRARTAYLAWLAARELPGTPRTVLRRVGTRMSDRDLFGKSTAPALTNPPGLVRLTLREVEKSSTDKAVFLTALGPGEGHHVGRSKVTRGVGRARRHLDHAAVAGAGERLAMTVLEEVVQTWGSAGARRAGGWRGPWRPAAAAQPTWRRCWAAPSGGRARSPASPVPPAAHLGVCGGYAMSEEAASWAEKIKVGNARAKSVLMRLGAFADAEGVAWAAVPTLADRLECDDRTIQRALRFLEKHGFIKNTGRFRYKTVPYYAARSERRPGGLPAQAAAKGDILSPLEGARRPGMSPQG